MKKKTITLLCASMLIISCKDKVSNTDATSVVDTLPATSCVEDDKTSPVLSQNVTVEENGTKLSTPKIKWEKASEACELSHYELAVGTKPGESDVMVYTNIGNVLEHTQRGLSLNYAKDYYYSLVAVDAAGNKSTPVNTSAWSIFTPKTLTNLMVWLDAADTNSILDVNGKKPGEDGFSNELARWKDISGSSTSHDFTACGAYQPNWDVTEKAVRFNGSQHVMATADHADINLSDISQRTLSVVIKTDSDTNSRQVVYEEGGTVRGINVYIEEDKLHCGFWNDRDDGDGKQSFVSVSETVEENKVYVVNMVFDYSHFSGRNGANGTVECFINEKSLGTVETTSRLHAHSGDIGLGAMNDGSYFADGADSGDDHYFKGVIYEFLMYNSAHSADDVEKLAKILTAKWVK